MNKTINKILIENLTGRDLTSISYLTGYSTSKIQKYLKGDGTVTAEYDTIMNKCFEYFCEKYRTLLENLEQAKNQNI